jgi:hypothetical protein
MIRPKFWWPGLDDGFKAVRPPVIPPVFLLFLSCFSPLISARIRARMVNPACGAGTKKKNRKISTNELLEVGIIKPHQLLAERAVSRFPRPKSWWIGVHALRMARSVSTLEPAR